MHVPDIYYLQSDHTSIHKNLGGQKRTAAHRVLPNSAEVGSSIQKPPTSLAHSGLNFVGTAGTVRRYNRCHHVPQYCRYGSTAGLKIQLTTSLPEDYLISWQAEVHFKEKSSSM
jgi:hypothetical protein